MPQAAFSGSSQAKRLQALKRKGILERRLHRVELELQKQEVNGELARINARAKQRAKDRSARSRPMNSSATSTSSTYRKNDPGEVDVRITKLFQTAVQHKYGELEEKSRGLGSIPIERQRKENMQRGVSMRMNNKAQRESVSRRRRQRAPVPVAGAFKPRKGRGGCTTMPRRYKRSEFPFKIGHKGCTVEIEWTCALDRVDIYRLMPLLFEGLRETEPPYNTLANQGLIQCVKLAREHNRGLARVVPKLIPEIRAALATRRRKVVKQTLLRLQDIMRVDSSAGVALMGYYRQLLVVFNLFITDRRNLGDGIEYGQRNYPDLGALILETLELLEQCAGPTASAKIKTMVGG